MTPFYACHTFDLDYANYTQDHWALIDEFNIVENVLLPYLDAENIKATWFVRIDKKIGLDFGSPDALFKTHAKTIEKLRLGGHDIAWHLHSYIQDQGKWKQNCNEDTILQEMTEMLPLVKQYNLDIFRMGWAFMTNNIMAFLADNNFKIESSAIPRPSYPWDMTQKDWEISTHAKYYPSKTDYRIPSPTSALPILEIPMSTFPIPSPTDQETGIIRYCNFSFFNDALKEPLKTWIQNNHSLITISHPYEFVKGNKHALISFSFDEFKKNIQSLKSITKSLGLDLFQTTLSEEAKRK